MQGDQPIAAKSEDKLGRAAFAVGLAQTLRSIDASRGAVVAVLGPWGSGKTSTINMVSEALGEAPSLTVLEFNPWLFSDTEQLVVRFFDELAAQVRLRNPTATRVADMLIEYGRLLAPLQALPAAGPWIQGIRAVTGFATRRLGAGKQPSADAVRRRLEAELASRDQPLVVVIDDLDRLEAKEIRDVVRLVRLVGHFPQVIYLLAFDRKAVETALAHDGATGRTYLEKIVEYTFDLPPPAPTAVEKVLLAGLADVIGSATGSFDSNRWTDVFYRVIRPLITSLRDVRRYVAVVPAAFATLGDEVAVVDVLALEAFRVLLPQVHSEFASIAAVLTAEGDDLDENAQQAIQTLAESAGSQREAVEQLCRLVFPLTQRFVGGTSYGSEWVSRWRREGRVASRAVLDFYLTRTLSPGVAPASTVRQAFESLPFQVELTDLQTGIDDSVFEDLVTRLESYQQEFPAVAAKPASAVLLNQYGRLRAGSLGFIDPGPEIKVDRLILRLLERVADSLRTQVVEQLVDEPGSLYGKLRVLNSVGHRPNAGVQLIPEADWRRMHQNLCRHIRHLEPWILAAERDPFRMLWEALEDDPVDRTDVDMGLTHTQLFLAVLRNAVGEVRTRSADSLSVERSAILHWELLMRVVGDELHMHHYIEVELSETNDLSLDDTAALELAQKYISGWRPERPRLPVAIRRVVAANGPDTFLSPTGMLGGFPDLVLRVVGIYEVAGRSDTRALRTGRALHDHLASVLSSSRFTTQLGAIAEHLGDPLQEARWIPDREVQQNSQTVVSRIDWQGLQGTNVLGRYGILPSGAIRVIADACVWYPTSGTSDSRDASLPKPTPQSTPSSPISLSQARDLLSSQVDAVSGPDPTALLRGALAEARATLKIIELHLVPRRGTDANRPLLSLAEVVDLSILGEPASRPAYEGHAAIEIDESVGIPDSRDLVSDSLGRMATDWGYLDAEAGLAKLT